MSRSILKWRLKINDNEIVVRTFICFFVLLFSLVFVCVFVSCFFFFRKNGKRLYKLNCEVASRAAPFEFVLHDHWRNNLNHIAALQMVTMQLPPWRESKCFIILQVRPFWKSISLNELISSIIMKTYHMVQFVSPLTDYINVWGTRCSLYVCLSHFQLY